MKKYLRIIPCCIAFAAAPQYSNAQEQQQDSTFFFNTPVFGGSVGTPGVCNIIGGYYWKKGGVKLELGGIPFPVGLQGWVGVQANLSSIVIRSSNFLMELSLLGIYINIPTHTLGTEYSGFGGSWSINCYGLFLELGLTYGSNRHAGSLFPVLQIGYVH